jgi:hypothetical protein
MGRWSGGMLLRVGRLRVNSVFLLGREKWGGFSFVFFSTLVSDRGGMYDYFCELGCVWSWGWKE